MLSLEDIREHCDQIAELVRGMSCEEFLADRLTYKAVSYSLVVIGVVVKQLPLDTRTSAAEVERDRFTELSAVLVERYFALDDRIVWNAATASVPELRMQVQGILDDLN
ncbi:MAG TPA: HepT-like ribonuclease domain-containing protein [Longimicrobiaceae bacterium]